MFPALNLFCAHYLYYVLTHQKFLLPNILFKTLNKYSIRQIIYLQIIVFRNLIRVVLNER